MRQLTLDLDSLTVMTFEPVSEEAVAPASTTIDLMWCASTGGPYFCNADCA